MFCIDEFKTNTRNPPIAVITGLPKGTKKKFVYLEKYKPSIDDLDDKTILEKLNDKQLEDLKTSIKTGYEPEDNKLIKIYYSILDELKKSKQRLVIKEGKLQPLPNPQKVERVYTCGISGSGKSVFSSNYIKEYLKIQKGNEFFLTSQIEEDKALDKLDPVRISPEELVENGIELDDVKNSIWCFDDVYSIENKSHRNMVVSIIDNLAETSRHDNISLMITSHLISNGLISRRILNESTKVVLFPKSNKKNIVYFLEKYERFAIDDVKRFINLNSRWVMLDKQNDIPVILYEKGAYIL